MARAKKTYFGEEKKTKRAYTRRKQATGRTRARVKTARATRLTNRADLITVQIPASMAFQVGVALGRASLHA